MENMVCSMVGPSNLLTLEYASKLQGGCVRDALLLLQERKNFIISEFVNRSRKIIISLSNNFLVNRYSFEQFHEL